MATRQGGRRGAAGGTGGGAMVALLRGINVGGNRKVPMADLRAVATGLGWRDAATHVQSGNLVFRATGAPAALAAALAQALARRFGFEVPVAVCTGARWRELAATCPFADAAAARPAALHLGLSTERLAAGAAAALVPYCRAGERVHALADAVWIDYVGGVASSKLTSAVLDRAFGGTVTMRNWRSVQAIAALLPD